MTHHSTVDAVLILMNRKVKSFKQCQKLQRVWRAGFGLGIGPQSFLPIVNCPVDNIYVVRTFKSAQYAVQMCQVATVVMETTQLILCQFKIILP